MSLEGKSEKKMFALKLEATEKEDRKKAERGSVRAFMTFGTSGCTLLISSIAATVDLSKVRPHMPQ